MDGLSIDQLGETAQHNRRHGTSQREKCIIASNSLAGMAYRIDPSMSFEAMASPTSSQASMERRLSGGATIVLPVPRVHEVAVCLAVDHGNGRLRGEASLAKELAAQHPSNLEETAG